MLQADDEQQVPTQADDVDDADDVMPERELDARMQVLMGMENTQNAAFEAGASY